MKVFLPLALLVYDVTVFGFVIEYLPWRVF